MMHALFISQVASSSPEGLKSIDVISSLCPSKIWRSFPDGNSHILAVLSNDPVANLFSYGLLIAIQ